MGRNHRRDYRRSLKQWLSTTDVSSEKHGMLLWRALTGEHISKLVDQDDFHNAFYKLHRQRMWPGLLI